MCRYFLIDLIDDSTQITKISQKNQGKNEQRTFVGPLQIYTWGVFFFVISQSNKIYDYKNGMHIQ